MLCYSAYLTTGRPSAFASVLESVVFFPQCQILCQEVFVGAESLKEGPCLQRREGDRVHLFFFQLLELFLLGGLVQWLDHLLLLHINS